LVTPHECTWTLSALEALRNALYKFKTYLLTLLTVPHINQSRNTYRVCPWSQSD